MRKRVFWYCEKWQVGGIQKIQVELLKRVSRDLFQFDVAACEDDTSFFDDELKRAGARKIVTLHRRYASPGIRTVVNYFAVRRLLRTGKYDIAYFNVCHGVELIYLFAAKRSGIPMRIVHCRNNDIGAGGCSRPIKLLAHSICKRLFSDCANIKLANSDLAAHWLYTEKDLRNGCVEIINNGIDAEAFSFREDVREAVRRENGWESSFVVGNIGHFSYQKNHAFLLEIFAELRRTVPNSLLLLVGEGDEEEQMHCYARELGMEDSVVFFGVSNAIPDLMSAMDVFVLPSRFEGFGNVLIEAQAAGLKCFASSEVIPAAAAVTDLVTWISLDSPARLWAEQIAMEADGYRRCGCADAVIRSGYDISSMASRLETIFLEGEKNG